MDDLKPFYIEYLPMLNTWFKQWGQPQVTFMDLPPIGFIYKNIAAGFLSITDTEVAILDYYVVDKNAYKEDRTLGLKKITEKLIAFAMADHCTKIMAITNNPAIFKYCEHFGLKDLGPSHVFVRGL